MPLVVDDIVVRFYEETQFGECIWEDFADFSTNDIHRQVRTSKLQVNQPTGKLQVNQKQVWTSQLQVNDPTGKVK